VKRPESIAMLATASLVVLLSGCPVTDPPLAPGFPATVSEGMSPNPELIITLPGEREEDVTVAITSSNPAFRTVPASVVVPAGQLQVTVEAVSVDNAYLDFDLAMLGTISAAGYMSAEAAFLFTDNESTALSVTVPATVDEGSDSVVGEVALQPGVLTRNGLDISVDSSDPSAVTVQGAVHIAPGASFIDFDIFPQEDMNSIGEDVDITASHPQMIPGYDAIHVNDND
jgi:hypothetical protein